jgi:hypothetical protein
MSRLLIMLAVLAFASGAYGVLIEKGGTVLFSDDFEGVAPGNAPDNGAAPGTWGQEVYGNDTWVKVVNDAMPGAYQGSQYASLNRGKEPPGSEAFLHGQFDSQTTGLLKTSFMLYIPSAGQGFLPAAINLAGGTENDAFPMRVVWLAAWADGNNVREYREATGWSNTGVTWAYDKWQKWEIELDMGASDLDFTDSYTVAVDGVKSVSIPVSQERSVSYLNMRCATGDGSSFYVDAVPEPATMALFVLGGLGVLRRRR